MSQTNAWPAALNSSMSSHGGSFISQGSSKILVEGNPPLCVGDTHQCPQILPSGTPHPALPICNGSAAIFVNKQAWLRVNDIVPCAGPCQIATGAKSVFLGTISFVQKAPTASIPFERFST